MRVRDDPRAAAELFCRQNGVTDTDTINLLEETLRGLYFPSSSSPPPSSPQSPLLPEPAAVKTWPRTSETKPGTSVYHENQNPATPRGEASTDAEDVLDETSRRSEGLGASGDSAHEPRGQVPNPSESPALSAAQQAVLDAVETTQYAATRRPEQQHRQHHQQQHDQHRHYEPNKGSRELAAETAATTAVAAAAAAAAAAESPAETVMEVAARMRDAAGASHDPADPYSVLVDLVVNGDRAPLAFRIPRKPARSGGGGGDRCHAERREVDDIDDDDGGGGHENHHHNNGGGGGGGGGGGSAEEDEGARGVLGPDDTGVSNDNVARGNQESGGRGSGSGSEDGGGDDAQASRPQRGCNEHDDVGEAGGQDDGQTQAELQGQAVAVAAREWCRAFGSDRAGDISFVEAEIRKAMAVALTAAEAAAATAVEAAGAAAAAEPGWEAAAAAAAGAVAGTTAAANAEREVVWSEAVQDRQRSPAEPPERAALSRPAGGPDGRGAPHQEHAAGGGGGRGKKEREGAERLTVTSVLAPDVEKGASMFWVKADPSLPELYVLAGFSALELSEMFCREHRLGSSQIPLVAWKVLEAYPLQMEAARKDRTLPPAGVTLVHAACQREVQVASILLLAALLWVTRRRLSGWLAREAPAGTGSHRRRRKKGAAFKQPWDLVRRTLPSWAHLPQRTEHPRGQRIAALPRERKGNKPVYTARYTRGAAPQGDTSANNTGAGTPAAATASAAAGASSSPANPATETNCDNTNGGDDRAGGGGGGGGGNGGEWDSPRRRSPHEPWPSRLSSWADAALFESGRLSGAAVRLAVRRPMAWYVRSGMATAGASVHGTKTVSIPATTEVVAKPSGPKGSKGVKKGPGNAAARGASKGAAGGSKPAAEVASRKLAGDIGDSSRKNNARGSSSNDDVSEPAVKAAPFAGGDVQRVVEGADGREKSGTEEGAVVGERPAAGEAAAATEPTGGSGRRQHETWASVLDSLARDPGNRFLEIAILSSAGHVLAKGDAFVMETHEACDWTRLFRNKKGDITVGGHKFVVLSREEGAIIISSKTLGSKMIGSKTRSGSAVVGAYADLSKSEAREGVAWLVGALASAAVH